MPLAIDGHVHLQRDMPWDRIAANFAQAAPGHSPVCLVVESAGVDRFSELESHCIPWGEYGAKDARTDLSFIVGRQVVSAEGLEILLIGSRDQSLEGVRADKVIATGLDRGAAVCLPWGFGKWIGERRHLASELHARLSQQIVLGDITNRPGVWPEPIFRNRRILRGSDNLPLQGSSDGVGLFGSIITPDNPVDQAEQVVAMLRDLSVALQPFGKRKATVASIREQVRFRFAKDAA